MTITLPIHPLVGQALSVVRWRARRKRKYVVLEHPKGGQFSVPVGWTDRAAPVVVPSIEGQLLKLDLAGLQRLVTSVGQKLDSGSKQPTVPPHQSGGGNVDRRPQGPIADTAGGANVTGVGGASTPAAVARPRRSGLLAAKAQPSTSRGKRGSR